MRAAVCLLCVGVAGCSIFVGDDSDMPPVDSSAPFGDFVELTELNTGDRENNPTLTGDMLEIYFNSNRPGGRGSDDIWRATRASDDDPFGTPTNVAELNSGAQESNPEITPDGLTLYLTVDPVPMVTHRASRDDPWDAPTPVPGFTTGGDGCAPTPDDLVIWASTQNPRKLSRMTRTLPTQPWPSATPVDEVNGAGAQRTPWLAAEESVVYFVTAFDLGNDVEECHMLRTFVSDRPGTFQAPEELTEFNTVDAACDNAPWLDPSGHTMFFARVVNDRGDLFFATR